MNVISLIKTWLMAISLVITVITSAEPVADQNEFLAIATQIRKEWKQLELIKRPLSKVEVKELQENVVKWSKQSKFGESLASYFVARFVMIGEQHDAEKKLLISSLSISMLPEGIDLMPINMKTSAKESSCLFALYTHSLAELLPISSWQTNCDYLCTAHLDDVNPSPDLVPTNDKETMLRIAVELERAMLWDLAWRAYANTVYSCYGSPRGSKFGSWISPEVGPLWIKVAECAYNAGKKDLAIDYLMKAAVFGTDDLQNTVRNKIAMWLPESIVGAKLIPVDKTIRCQALTKVIQLYMEINAQPQAFQLLDEYHDIIENSESLREQAERQWLTIIKYRSTAISDPSNTTNKVTLYGQEVYPKGEPLKVRIHSAFSDEAVASVRNKLKESISREFMPASSKKVETDK